VVASQPKVLITRDEIEQAVVRLAAEIKRDYKDSHPLLIGTLKGSFVFLADLIRHLDIPLDIDFIQLSSYGAGKESSGKVKLVKGLKASVTGQHVLIVEDIGDTGLTVSMLFDYLRKKKPASLKLCAFMDKPSRRRVPVDIDYLGFTVPDKFIVGYGTDCNENFRHLPDICSIE